MKDHRRRGNMTLTIDLTPEQESRLLAAADLEHTKPQALIQKWVDHLPAAQPLISDDDPTIAYALARIKAAPTDPEAVREAEEDLRDFMRNMNLPRKEAGARLHYPEVE
jgi:hypothetical protein